MKIAVYDSKNSKRHLGDLEHYGTFGGRIISIPTRGTYGFPTPSTMPNHRIDFKIDALFDTRETQISALVREVTRVERKVLTTEIPLNDLMKLDQFTLPGESKEAARRRRDRTVTTHLTATEVREARYSTPHRLMGKPPKLGSAFDY